MEIVRTIRELRECIATKPVAFVPTMGYLHEGHLSLIRQAKSLQKQTVVSLFVNPKQFNDPNDLGSYPRNEVRDAELSESAGCDFLFAPTVDEMYPQGFATNVTVSGIGELWEGMHRPGHFQGVATVVARLFGIVGPCTAFFGEKDWQQCCVVNRIVEDLALPVQLQICPTVREQDGLAMSSRNTRLSPIARAQAPGIYNSLKHAAERAKSNPNLREIEMEATKSIQAAGFDSVDYVAIVNQYTLQPLDAIAPNARIIAAATIEGVRLIDNLKI